MKRLTTVMLVLFIAMGAMAAEGDECLNGEFWRDQALNDIIPYWWEHAIDEENGGFYMDLNRQWQASGTDKYPLTISRDVFGFAAAYLLSGEEKYLETAREGLDYLLEHAWDEEYGGWFVRLSQTGDPYVSRSKNVPYQLYTNVGPTLYYFVSGDERALSHVKESVRIRRTYARDEEYGGYYYGLNRNLSPSNRSKRKHAHFGYLGSLMPDLCMATRDSALLAYAEELAQLSIGQMLDEYGWVGKNFTRQWVYEPMERGGKDVVDSGVELTAANAFLRLYQLTGKELYREHGVALGEQTMHCAWDSVQGGWNQYIEREPPHKVLENYFDVYWWIQCYGSFIQLQLYHITGDERYLDKFKIGAEFWNQYFIDKEYGGVFFSVSPNGSTRTSGKGEVWKTAYHEMEHALLNYLYVSLYVNHQPAVLHFWLKDTRASSKHYVSLVEDPLVQITAVKINGEPWTDFDAQERSVSLPEAGDVKMEVTLAVNESSVEDIHHSTSVIPDQIELLQNYPNPFNPETRIRYELPQPDRVVLKVLNLLGQEMRTLVDQENSAGCFEVLWDGKDNRGQHVASGVYLYRIKSQDFVQTKKLVLLQ